MPDIVIPIVFPDYMISVNTPNTNISIPDLLPGFDMLPDSLTIPGTKNKIPELGHAGALFINSITGTTKYYEYGRYSPLGTVRKLSIRDVRISHDGHPEKTSLTYTLSQISAKSGQGGLILGAYIEVPGKFKVMQSYAIKRFNENTNPKRQPYELFSNSCNHFMKGVLEVAGVDVPYMIDPRPNSYIEEIRDDFPKLSYSKVENKLMIENPPLSLANARNALAQPAAA